MNFEDSLGGEDYTSLPLQKAELGSFNMPPYLPMTAGWRFVKIREIFISASFKPRLECCDISPLPPSGNSLLLSAHSSQPGYIAQYTPLCCVGTGL